MPTPRLKPSRNRRRTDLRPLLRWVFRRAGRMLTCEVDMRRRERAYDVCVVPHWNVSSSIIETYDTPIGALRRHAQLARSLREAGWALAAHVAVHDAA